MVAVLGSTEISKAYLGTSQVVRAYLGGTLVFSSIPGISGNAGGTVDITIDDGTFSVTVSGSDYAHQNGTFGPFDTADLDSGPVLVVAPVISGPAVEGSTLTAEPGLWVYDTADGTTTVSAIWQVDGVDISGETGTTYVTVGGDVGAEITYEEDATNDAGTRTSDSNGITVTASGAWSTEVVENFIRINSMVNVTAPTSEVVGNKIRITA